MAPGRRRGAGKGSAAAAARHQWKPGDLVLAKVKGYPAWPATVSEPQKWGYSRDWKKVLVYFFGTYQIAFCNPSDVEPFTEDKKSSLLTKCQGKGADFVRAVDEIIEMAEKVKQSLADEVESGNDGVVSDIGVSQVATSSADNSDVKANPCLKLPSLSEPQSDIFMEIDSYASVEASEPRTEPAELADKGHISREHILNGGGPNQAEQLPFLAGKFSRKRSKNVSVQISTLSRHFLSAQHCNTLSLSDDLDTEEPSLVGEDSDGNFPPEQINNVARELSGEFAKKGTDSSAITQKLSNDLDIGNPDRHPINSSFGLSYSPTSFVAIESSSDGRSSVAIKGGACTFRIGNICTNEKFEVSELIGESSDRGTEVSSMAPLSDLERSKVCLGLDNGQMKTSVFKKKRKPHKKKALLDTSESSQRIPLSGGCKGSPLRSPDTCFKANEHFVAVNGDEHLPLVKRARVRMEKPLEYENEQCSLDAAEKGSTEGQGDFPTLATISRSGDAHMAISSTIGDKESITSFSVSNDNLKPKENGTCLPWKAKKYHLIGSVDSEASLPPSKRLHRALEAMSANVAEAAETAAETSIEVQRVEHQQASEVHSSSGFDIVENNIHNPSIDDNVETPVRAMFQKPHDHVRLIGDAFERSASEPPGLPVETCSKEKLHDYTVRDHDGSPPEDIIGMEYKGEKIVEESFCSEIHETCSLSESKHSSTSVQGVSVDSSSPRRHGSTDPMLLTESGSAFTTYTMEVNRSCDNFRKELSENAEAPKVQPVGWCQSEHPIIQEGNSVATEKGNGDSLHVMSKPDDDGCTSSAKHGNNVVSLKPQIEEGADLTSRNQAGDGREFTPRANNADLVSEFIPKRGLLFAAQSKGQFSHSSSFNCHSSLAEERTADCFASSEFPPDKVNPCEALHHKASATPDDGKHQFFINSCMSPDASSFHNFNVEDKPIVGRPSCGEKSLDRAIENAKCSSVLKSFEAMLFTLSRTKDSIGRATRVAIDCAKYGIAKEVVDILLRYLESEPSLHRKVDLFFLVDSIIQCSRGQKGMAGESYSSAVQAVLPRLISAAVPPGTAARENHRQCLKVLKLWLERKTLPESVVRKHMQELEALGDSCILPRRSLRTERALNDPLREMEGMLVDEYGSNTSLQISGLTMPRLLEDEEEISATYGKSIAALPPVEACKSMEESKEIAKPASEKHRHILEAVDGELEMEDVSPSCETEVSASDVPRSVNTLSSINQFDKCHSLPVDQPPLPEEIPPSPPPLPSSPPPGVQPTSGPPPLTVHSSISHSFVEPELHCAHKNNYQGQLQQQFFQQQAVGHASSSHLDAVPHSCPGYMDHQIRMQNIAPFGSSGPYSGSQSAHLTVPTGNNIQPIIGPRLPNKNFHVRPPTCAVSNQFSFLHSEPQQRFQPWLESSPSSFQGPSQLMHSRPREPFSNDTGGTRNMQDQMDVGCRFAANNHAGPHKTENMYGHPSHYGHSEHQNRWQSLPLVGMDYHQNSQSFNHPPLQRQISGVSGTPGPSVWRPT